MRKDTQILDLSRLMVLLLGLAAAAGARADGTEAYTGNLPWAAVSADFNGDGMQDLAVVNYYDNNVSILINTTGSGSPSLGLAAAQDFAVGQGPEAVVVADFNGDSLPDLATANCNDNTVTVVLNTTVPGSSTASFTAPAAFAAGNSPCALTVADINGDGKPDLVSANLGDNTISVFINTTPNGASTPSFAAAQTFATGSSPWALTAVDLNGDGLQDIAVVNLDDNTVSVLINTTVNGSATAGFVAQQVFAAGNGPQSVAAGDINGDGLQDLVVVGYADNSVSVLLNTTVPSSTTAGFASEQIFNAVSSSFSVSVVDVNGDGLPDVVVADAGSSTAAVLVNTTVTGSGTVDFAPEQDFSADGGWSTAVVVADMNGDGMPEITLVNAGSGEVDTLLNATAPGDTTVNFLP
jgi:hypothetical protein